MKHEMLMELMEEVGKEFRTAGEALERAYEIGKRIGHTNDPFQVKIGDDAKAYLAAGEIQGILSEMLAAGISPLEIAKMLFDIKCKI